MLLCSDISEDKEKDAGALDEIRPLPEVQGEVQVREFDPNWWPSLQALYPNHKIYLRYFKPMELIRLFGFHSEFVFPARIALKKQYELIGNSVNVSVVGILLKQLFSIN